MEHVRELNRVVTLDGHEVLDSHVDGIADPDVMAAAILAVGDPRLLDAEHLADKRPQHRGRPARLPTHLVVEELEPRWAPAVLVNGGRHWVCVTGYQFDDNTQAMTGIYYTDPGFTGLGRNVGVTPDAWNNWFTPVSGGVNWLGQIIEVRARRLEALAGPKVVAA